MYTNPRSVLLGPSPRPSQTPVDAPSFLDTDILQTVVTSDRTIKPEIQAKIHKGFFRVDDKWTCYRRNYFSVSCSFFLRPWLPNVPLYLQLPNRNTEQIISFSMSISAIVNAQDGEIRELVQHTLKRDKQSKKRPGKITLQPLQTMTLGLSHGTTNHTGVGTQPHSVGTQADYGHPYASSLQPSHPPTTHKFERIQFQKATANNGKRRAQQQYYNLVVELYAEISHPVGSGTDGQWIKVARKISHPMVVRGRSPGHYKDVKRDSSASTGPDSGTGSSGDGNRGTVLPPGIIGQASLSRSHIVSYDSARRGSSHYSRNGQHQLASADHSPLSASWSPHRHDSSSIFEFTMSNDSMDPAEVADEAPHSVHIMILPLAWQLQCSSRRSPLSNVDFSAHEEGSRIPRVPLMIALTLSSLFSQMIKMSLPSTWSGHLVLQELLVAKWRRDMTLEILVESAITPTADLMSCRPLRTCAHDFFWLFSVHFLTDERKSNRSICTICISLSNSKFSRSRFLLSKTAYTSSGLIILAFLTPRFDKHISWLGVSS